jgi:Virulence-associated protein E/Primase C terminal 1 (PriCT-1)
MNITMFKSLRDKGARRYETTWEEIVAKANTPKVYPAKDKMPLIKLACFGTDTGRGTLLRNEANMLCIHGVEGDYDAERLSPDDAITALGMAGITALIYTTPGHQDGAPRWRLLAPLSTDHPVAERRKLLGRINGVLDGILADESFVNAQSYFWGRVAGVPYRALSSVGEFVDLRDDLDAGAIFPAVRHEAAPVDGAAEAGQIVEGGRNRWLFERAAALRRAGMSEAAILAALRETNTERCQPPLDDNEVEAIAHSAARYEAPATLPVQAPVPAEHAVDGNASGDHDPMLIPARIRDARFHLISSVDGLGCSSPPRSSVIHASIANTLALVQAIYKDVLWFDAWVGRPMYHTIPLADHHVTKATALISALPYAHAIGLRLVAAAMVLVARDNTIDPIVEWLNQLVWDGTPRLDDLAPLGYGCANNEDAEPNLESLMLRKLMIAVVARQYKPGAQFNHMVVLEGEQGTRKSSSLRALFGNPFVADWTRGMDTKDFQQQLQGFLCIEVSELASLAKSEQNAIKATVSATTDTYRTPYDKFTEAHPRRCVLVGTSNANEYLEDQTGNRRYWPVVTGNIHLDWIANNREQLFAEAVVAYRAGEQWYFESPTQELVDEQEARVEIDIWTEPVLAYVAGKDEVRVQEILVGDRVEGLYGPGELRSGIGQPIDRHDRRSQMRVAAILKKNGWRKVDSGGRKLWRKVD